MSQKNKFKEKVEELSEEEEFQKRRDEYWGQLISRMDYFKEESTNLDENIFSLDSYSENNKIEYDHFRNSIDTNYPIFARYWSSQVISNHINFMWLMEYKEARKNNDEKTANKIADSKREDRKKSFKERYP